MNSQESLRLSGAKPAPSSPGDDPIRDIGDTLVSRYKAIDAAWAKAEERLARIHTPVRAEIKVGSEVEEDSDGSPLMYETQYLSFCRWRGKWRICYEQHVQLVSWCGPGDGREHECRPVVEAPVDIRLAMFEHFEDLEAAVVRMATAYIPKIDNAVAAFEKILES